MEENEVSLILKSIIKYLQLVHSDVYEISGKFNEEDEETIKRSGFKPEMLSFYDGKILRATDENIATYSAKCQCVHSIYIKDQFFKNFNIEFHVVEENRFWSSDHVYDLTGKDDQENDNYVVLKKNSEINISQIQDIKDLPENIINLYSALKKYIIENHKDLRLRLIIDKEI